MYLKPSSKILLSLSSALFLFSQGALGSFEYGEYFETSREYEEYFETSRQSHSKQEIESFHGHDPFFDDLSSSYSFQSDPHDEDLQKYNQEDTFKIMQYEMSQNLDKMSRQKSMDPIDSIDLLDQKTTLEGFMFSRAFITGESRENLFDYTYAALSLVPFDIIHDEDESGSQSTIQAVGYIDGQKQFFKSEPLAQDVIDQPIILKGYNREEQHDGYTIHLKVTHKRKGEVEVTQDTLETLFKNSRGVLRGSVSNTQDNAEEEAHIPSGPYCDYGISWKAFHHKDAVSGYLDNRQVSIGIDLTHVYKFDDNLQKETLTLWASPYRIGSSRPDHCFKTHEDFVLSFRSDPFRDHVMNIKISRSIYNILNHNHATSYLDQMINILNRFKGNFLIKDPQSLSQGLHNSFRFVSF